MARCFASNLALGDANIVDPIDGAIGVTGLGWVAAGIGTVGAIDGVVSGLAFVAVSGAMSDRLSPDATMMAMV